MYSYCPPTIACQRGKSKMSKQAHRKTGVRTQADGQTTILWFYDDQKALARLAELHRVAVGLPGTRRTISSKLKKANAPHAHMTSLACMLASFQHGTTKQRTRMFNGLLRYVRKTKSFDGLESPFLTGLHTMALARSRTPETDPGTVM